FAAKPAISGRSSSPPTFKPTICRFSTPYFACSEFRCGISSIHGGQNVAQKSRITALPSRSFNFCVPPSRITQLISPIGLPGGIGRLVVGRSLIDTGVFETETGAAAGRQAEESKKAKVKRQKKTTRIENQS